MRKLVQIFLSAKTFRSTKLKRSPRDIRWTVLYRIKHKKGSYGQENVQRKKVKKTTHTLNRAVAGMSLEAILAKRNQTSDFRRQQREQAAKAAKEANKAARAAKAAMNKGSYGQENVQRKKVKKTTHTLNRAVAGMSLEAILAKRNQTSDFRRQQREQAAKAAKEANKAARAAKAAMNKEKKPTTQKMKPPKPVKTAAPRVGGKR
ncbi:hypothetical protein TELCIR_05990 [Teladorsagia circumcincta]|uniref:Large ribosomal subunit protein eL24 n=1 Tax=Teladorsagia circumcincta TaxID=45464 RepID=A0A2G9UQW4_TELCI|nr:hypothetical protein TELCIR_05990 [Teladorsagia circumcincta]